MDVPDSFNAIYEDPDALNSLYKLGNNTKKSKNKLAGVRKSEENVSLPKINTAGMRDKRMDSRLQLLNAGNSSLSSAQLAK